MTQNTNTKATFQTADKYIATITRLHTKYTEKTTYNRAHALARQLTRLVAMVQDAGTMAGINDLVDQNTYYQLAMTGQGAHALVARIPEMLANINR